MESLRNFKILLRYFKNDKLRLSLYIILTILKYFEPLSNAFIWAFAFEALANGNSSLFITYLIIWSSVMIFTWVIIQIPGDLIYNTLEKKFIENVNKDLYKKIGDMPAIAFEEIGSGEFINRMYTDPNRILELLQKLIKLTCRLIIAIIIVFISFSVSIYVGLELLVLVVVMFILSNIYYPRIKKTEEEIKKDSDEYIKVATQNISGIREIKALGIKENINRNIFKIIEDLFSKQRKIGKDEAWYYVLNNLCYFIMQFVILLTLGLGYFDATSGKILVNGLDIKDLTEKSLRENISVIRQSPFLFNETIFANFKIVKEDVTIKEVRSVCKKTYIDDYIMSLPDGYDTLIVEGGINLSGGQKQRLAIARTLLKDTKVILFDEATSALDNESQEYIKRTIDSLVKTHTIIIVAHRLSTIMDADIIYVIDDGKVLECGNHTELMEKSELYQKLYSPEVLDF